MTVHHQITRDKEIGTTASTENSGHALDIFLCYAFKTYIMLPFQHQVAHYHLRFPYHEFKQSPLKQ